MKTRKGQSATETMVTIGMVLVFVVPIVLLLLVGAQARFESLSHVQAGSCSRIIADSINEVYAEGPGASKVAIVNIPSNALLVGISENEVTIALSGRTGPSEVVAPFFGEVHEDSRFEVTNEAGATPAGLYPLKFYADEEGYVVIVHEGQEN
jgi:hypothetical protein